MSPQECEQKGCCWLPAAFPGAPHVDLPWCFRPNAEPSEYRVADLRQGEGGCCRGRPSRPQATWLAACACRLAAVLLPHPTPPIHLPVPSGVLSLPARLAGVAGGSLQASLAISKRTQPYLGEDIEVGGVGGGGGLTAWHAAAAGRLSRGWLCKAVSMMLSCSPSDLATLCSFPFPHRACDWMRSP